MALPSANQEITFANIQTEFGGSHPISISEYYRGNGGVVSSNSDNDAIPTGGNNNEISMSHFASTVFKSYVSWIVVAGGGGGGGGAQSGVVTGNPRGSVGSDSVLSGTNSFSTVTASGGQGGRSGHSSVQNNPTPNAAHGDHSPLTGTGRGVKGTWSAGAGGNASQPGAGGGGASGNNASGYDDDGFGGEGGSAGQMKTGNAYLVPGTVLTLNVGAGGAGRTDTHTNGGNGYKGEIRVTENAPNSGGTFADSTTTHTNASSNGSLTISDTAYSG